MDKNLTEDETLTRIILRIIKEKEPKDVQELVSIAMETTPLPQQKIIDQVLQLQSQKRIELGKPRTRFPPQSIGAYIRSKEARWYWITMILAVATTLSVITLPEDVYPQVFLRYTLAAVFIFWLPGYSFVRALFPQKQLPGSSSRRLGPLEQVALTLGTSIALVTMVGLLVNFTPWGIRLTPVLLGLLALTTVFSTLAILAEYQYKARRAT